MCLNPFLTSGLSLNHTRCFPPDTCPELRSVLALLREKHSSVHASACRGPTRMGRSLDVEAENDACAASLLLRGRMYFHETRPRVGLERGSFCRTDEERPGDSARHVPLQHPFQSSCQLYLAPRWLPKQ